jgi:hypothetical protein
MALKSGSMKLTPLQMLTLLAAADVLIPTTPVRYVTRLEATPLYTNLSTLATTATAQNHIVVISTSSL